MKIFPISGLPRMWDASKCFLSSSFLSNNDFRPGSVFDDAWVAFEFDAILNVLWFKMKHYRDEDESFNSYLNSVMFKLLKWNQQSIRMRRIDLNVTICRWNSQPTHFDFSVILKTVFFSSPYYPVFQYLSGISVCLRL